MMELLNTQMRLKQKVNRCTEELLRKITPVAKDNLILAAQHEKGKFFPFFFNYCNDYFKLNTNDKYDKGLSLLLKLFKPVKLIKLTYIIPKVGTRQHLPVELKVYDDLGNEIAKLVNEEKPAGPHEVVFDVTALKKGIYFYQVFAGSFVSVREMIELK